MTSVKEKIYTIDAIYALPDGQRAELIDGRIYMMAPPNTRHQNLVSEFTITIGNYIRSKGGNCKVFPAPFAVFLNNDNQNYVEPDISVICDKNKLDEKGCNGAPDWIIEIVSPSTSRIDYAPARGKRLTAEAVCLRSGRTTALYAVDIKDELGTYVAHATMNGYVIGDSRSN